MSFDETAIRVEGVSKHFLMFERPEDRLKQMIQPRLARLLGRSPRQYFRDFAALQSVSFEVKRGETVGIVGRNGCGKSTLLQIICGTLPPTSGRVEVNGRIAALLELGSGFNSEFTGRENVHINAAILGLSRREIETRFDAIARFADIGLFIDQPVKTYSSGMYMRLAFAVAINVDPDILVIDEALAVGDEAFSRKCYARIEEIKEKGATILFVSHSAQTVIQLCDRALLLDGGEKILEGRPKVVINQYQRLINASPESAAAIRADIFSMFDNSLESATANQDSEHAVVDEIEKTEPEARSKSEPLIHAVEPEPLFPLEAAISVPAEDDGIADYFDPNLKSQSTLYLEERGARIRDVRLATLDGKPVNVLRMGRRYMIAYDVDFVRCLAATVGFGFSIKLINGVAIGGFQTFNSVATRNVLENSTTSQNASFIFICSMLPGTYSIDAGVLGLVNSERMVLHRIQDALMFRVAIEGEKPATGLVDLAVKAYVRPNDTKLVMKE